MYNFSHFICSLDEALLKTFSFPVGTLDQNSYIMFSEVTMSTYLALSFLFIDLHTFEINQKYQCLSNLLKPSMLQTKPVNPNSVIP